MPGTKLPPDSILRINAQLADLLDAMAAAIPTSEPVAIGVVWADSGVLTVSVGIPPVITLQPQSQTVAVGLQATFTVTATNATSYQWELNSGAGYASISGATAASYETPVLTESENGNLYRCVVTGLGGEVTSDAATLTVPVIVTVPDDFGWTPPFTVYNTAGVYSTDYDPEEFVPATSTTYYVDVATGSDANPGTEIAPFKSIYQAVHNRSANILVYVKPGEYRGNNSWRAGIAGTNGGNYNVVVRRWGASGRIVSSLDLGDLSWSLHSGNVWKATVSGVTASRVVDSSVPDSHGNGVVLTNQTSVANVEANPGSSYYLSNTVYIRTLDSREPDANIRAYDNNTNGQFRGATLWVEHCDFLGGGYPFLSRNFALTNQKSYFHDCKFLYGIQAAGGVQMQNAVECIHYQCEASNNETDGFKYIADGGVYFCNYAEIDCVAYNAGIHNTTNISNGSSSHDGCKGIRINSVYAGSRGRPIHDITANRSWLLGCTSGPSVATVDDASKAAFASGTGTDASKMWLDGCTSLSTITDCEAATTAVIYTRDLTRTANSDIGTITAY